MLRDTKEEHSSIIYYDKKTLNLAEVKSAPKVQISPLKQKLKAPKKQIHLYNITHNNVQYLVIGVSLTF